MIRQLQLKNGIHFYTRWHYRELPEQSILRTYEQKFDRLVVMMSKVSCKNLFEKPANGAPETETDFCAWKQPGV